MILFLTKWLLRYKFAPKHNLNFQRQRWIKPYIMTLRPLITTLFSVFLFNGFSQEAISATIDISKVLPGVERNFTGFNSGQGNLEVVYKYNAWDADLSINPNFSDVFDNISKNICWRFPGGTTASYYNRWGSGYGNASIGQIFGDWLSFNILNPKKRNSIYKDYFNYNTPGYPNSKNNIIFPFINSITKNRTVKNNAVFCINIINHYRDVPIILYNTRRETLKDTNKIKEITDLESNYLDAFNNSTLSNEFKKIVRQNIDAYLTLVGNGVTVNRVEIGNELYAYGFHDNMLTDYSTFITNSNFFNQSDNKVWFRDDVSERSIRNSYTSLWTFAHLAKLYRVLLTDTLQKLSEDPENENRSVYREHLAHIKFGIPVSNMLNGGFKRWDDFMRQQDIKDYIGISAYIIHPYFDSINFFKNVFLSDLTNKADEELDREFRTIRDTLEISYDNRFFKTNQVNLINAFPEGSEVWYTEWNFNFDHSNLKKVGNTMLHAMYYYDAMMNFFDINANRNLNVSCNKINPVKICNYHMPYARNSTWYNMVRFPKWYNTSSSDPYRTANRFSNAVAYNATYFTHLLLSPVLDDSTLQYVDNINGGFDASENCVFRTFYKKDCSSGCCADNVYIYFNNKSDSDHVIDLISSLGITDTKCVSVSASYLYANKLYASMGQTTFRSDDFLYTQDSSNNAADVTIQRVFGQAIDDSLFRSVNIRKYSLGYIKATITIPSRECACGIPERKKHDPIESVINAENLIQHDKETNASSALRIYPNPSSGNISLDITSAVDGAAVLNIYDLAGTIIESDAKTLSAGRTNIPLDLSHLSKGTYLLRLKGESIDVTEKIILL
jgi:hypothetical protein